MDHKEDNEKQKLDIESSDKILEEALAHNNQPVVPSDDQSKDREIS